MQPLFTIKEALSFGWKKTVENLWFLIILTVATIIVSFAFDNVKGDFAPLFRILNMVVSYLAMYVAIKAGLKIFAGSKPEAKDVLDVNWSQFGWYILGLILSNIAIVIGFVLFIIPGIYLAVRLNMMTFTLIDQNLKPVDAFKKSLELTRGRFWKLLGFGCVIALINVLGVLAAGVGILISIPVSLLATVYVYEKLKAAPVVVAPAPTTPVATV
ncbi:MAG: hypothetical protein RLZZ67_137 [Candidatus Parcubacteria bacterium]|jgi:hypothetical protein